jgi:hypothetical protein
MESPGVAALAFIDDMRGGESVQSMLIARQSVELPAGMKRALSHVIAEQLPLVYSIAGRALCTPQAVHQVVRSVMPEALQDDDPGSADSFRASLVSLTMHHVRVREQAHRPVPAADLPCDPLAGVPRQAEPLDFASVAVRRLGLRGTRRELELAARWMDPADRSLLALWWLESAGHLSRDEVAPALGLGDAELNQRIDSVQRDLMMAWRLVRSLEAMYTDAECSGLRGELAGWSGHPSGIWRQRLTAHLQSCRLCTVRAAGMVSLDRVLKGEPLVPVTTRLQSRVLAVVAPRTETSRSGAGSAVSASPASVTTGRDIAGTGPVPLGHATSTLLVPRGHVVPVSQVMDGAESVYDEAPARRRPVDSNRRVARMRPSGHRQPSSVRAEAVVPGIAWAAGMVALVGGTLSATNLLG